MATIEQKHWVNATPVEVYEALLDGDEHSDLTGGEATSNPIVGGKMTAWDGYISGAYTELVEGKKIVQTWKTSEWPKGAPDSRLEFQFEAKDGGTEITMIHSEVPESQVESYRKGWKDYYWAPMTEYFGE